MFLRLVSDTADDGASENGAATDPHQQTIFVKLLDVVRFKYPDAGAQCSKELQVGRTAPDDDTLNQLKHDIREVQIHVVVFQKNTGGHR